MNRTFLPTDVETRFLKAPTVIDQGVLHTRRGSLPNGWHQPTQSNYVFNKCSSLVKGLLFVCLLMVGGVSAQVTKTSNGANWGTAGSWTPSGVPAANDFVIINTNMSTGNNTTRQCASLTINSGITLTISNNGTVSVGNGGVTINGSGAVALGNGNSVLQYAANTTLTYGGSVTKTLGDEWPTANGPTNVAINNSVSVTLNAARTIPSSGTLTLTSGNFATGTNLTMASTSSITRSSGSMTGTLQGAGIYNVSYTGNSKTTGTELGGSGLNNVTSNLTSGQTLTLGGPVTLAGTLTINSGNTLDVSGSNFAINIGGNWSNSGIFTPRAGTVIFNGTNQTIIRTGCESFNILAFTVSGTKTFGSSIAVGGNLSIANGVTADLGANSHTAITLTLNGAGARNGTWGGTSSAATFTNNTFFTATSTGILTVSTTSCSNPAVPSAGSQIKNYTGVANTTAITATAAAGQTIDWYSASTGGTPLLSGNINYTPTTPVNVAVYNYFAEARNTNTYCISGSRTTVTLTINPATLTYTATAASRAYGSANPTFSGTITGFVGSDNQSGATNGTLVFTSIATTTSSVGSYAIDGSGLTANPGNYTFVQAAGNATALTITPAPLTITGITADNKVYNGNTTASLSGTPVYSGLQNGETFSVTGTSVSTFNTAAVGTGKPVTVTGYTAPNTNYTVSQPLGLTADITASPLTVTATGPSKIYGTALTAGTSVSNFSVTGTPATGQSLTSVTLTPDAAGLSATTAAGAAYTVTPSAATGTGGFVASNYNITYIPFNGTVNAAALTITASAQSKIYGSTLALGTSAFTPTGLVNGETVGSVTLTSSGDVNTAAAGIYAIVPSAVTGGTFTETNYSITYVNGSLTVTPADLTITGLTADNKPYDGDATAALSGTPAYSGLQNGEIFSVTGTPVATFNTAAVGTAKPVTITGYMAPNTNYTVSQPTGLTADITAIPLTVTATGPAKTYGTALVTGASATDFTATGTVPGEAVTSVTLTPDAAGLSATTAAGAAYTVTPSAATGTGGFSAGNYIITYTAFNGTVSTAALTITASAQSKVYGTVASLGTSAFTTSGLVNSDAVSSVTLTSTTGSPATATVAGSPYNIVPSGATGTGLGNYTISYVNGNLTVTPAPLTIIGVTADNKVYDGNTTATLSGTATYAGLVNGESFSVTGTPSPTFNTAAVGNGKPVTVTGYTAPSTNYSVSQPTGLTANITGLDITIADFRSQANGDFSVPANWQYDQGGLDWVTATAKPSTTNNVTIFHDITLDESFTEGKTLRILAPGTLTIAPNANLDMQSGSSNIDFNNRSVTVKSTAAGTGSIGNMRGTLSDYNNVTVERYIPANAKRAWRLLSANTQNQSISNAWQEGQGPLTRTDGFGTMITGKSSLFADDAAATAAGFDKRTPNSSILYYDQPNDQLLPLPSTNTTNINDYPGYFLYIRGDRSQDFVTNTTAITATTLRSTGSLYLGNQTITVANTGGNPNGLTLVGNPFASAIDMRTVLASRTGGISQSFQVWDPLILGTYNLGAYQTFTFNSGANTYRVGTPGGSYPANNGSFGDYNNIESGSAFYLQNTGASGTVTIGESAKAIGSRIVNRPAGNLALSVELRTTLYAVVNNTDVLADGNLVQFDPLYNNSVDINDVRKNTNFGENFGITRDGQNLVVEQRQLSTPVDTIFFSMSKLKQTTYRLQIGTENISGDVAAFLEDTYTKTTTAINLLGPTSYSFMVDANAASSAANRFRIVFGPSGGPLPVTFTSIKAAEQGNNIAVEWNVGSQVNISKYDVEKSTDGRNFTTVGTIQAGNTTTYNWLDMAAVQGNNYYRVKATDLNVGFKYTQVVKITMGKKGSAIAVSPNPVQGNVINLQFINKASGKYQLNLTNAAGQLMYSNSLQHAGGSASQTLTLSAQVTRGIYQLEIVAPDQTRKVQKLIID